MRQVVLLLLSVALAGCSLGGDDGGSIEASQLRNLVLQPADVARVFILFDQGRQVTADSPGGRRSDTERFGRQVGWKARYRRTGTRTTCGPLVIESRADLFESRSGAEDELEAALDDLAESELGWREVDAPALGDESFASTHVEGAGGGGVRFFVVAWREDNVAASVFVNGFDGKIAVGDAVALARKQARRISQAAG